MTVKIACTKGYISKPIGDTVLLAQAQGTGLQHHPHLHCKNFKGNV